MTKSELSDVKMGFGPGIVDFEKFSRAANRPPDAALSPVDVAFLRIEYKTRAVVAERDLYSSEYEREELNADRWKSRYRSMCDFSAVSVALLAASIIAHLWRSL